MVKAKELEQYVAQSIAECFGTFMLVLIGEAGIAQYKLLKQDNHSTLTINLSFAIGVYTALMIAGPISGAHLNPAVSISLLTVRKMKLLQCFFYIIGQLIGAFFGALCVYFLYWTLINNFSDSLQVAGPNGTAGIFFTMPAEGVPQWNSFFDQAVGTAILMIFIMALICDANHMMSEVAKPFAFVLIIVAITSAFSANAGAAINPARDLGPRLFAAFIYGWKAVFQANSYFFWIPIVGPIVGGLVGTWVFEGYYYLMKRYSHSPNIIKDVSLELDPKVRPIDDDDQFMVTQKLTSDA